jgi:hypothetical protein
VKTPPLLRVHRTDLQTIIQIKFGFLAYQATRAPLSLSLSLPPPSLPPSALLGMQHVTDDGCVLMRYADRRREREREREGGRERERETDELCGMLQEGDGRSTRASTASSLCFL